MRYKFAHCSHRNLGILVARFPSVSLAACVKVRLACDAKWLACRHSFSNKNGENICTSTSCRGSWFLS